MSAKETTILKKENFWRAPVFEIEGTEIGKYYEDLLRGFIHRLNNSLAVIQGFASLIMMDDIYDEETQENLKQMKDASIRASLFGERVLSAGGCCNVTDQKVDLVSYLTMINETIHKPFKDNNVNLTLNVDRDIPLIKADSVRLKEIIVELLNNAAETSEENGGNVTLNVYKPGVVTPEEESCVDLLFTNTEATIDRAKFSLLFKPFYTCKKNNHVGVGLSIAAVIAKKMNCRLGLHSYNNVTTFWLSIPVKKQ